MAGMIQVTPKMLRDKAGELRNQNKSLRSHIESLRTQEGGLSGMWEGEARDTFKREFTKDITRMDEFCAAIDAYANALDTIATQYENAEHKNTGLASSRQV